MGRSTWKSSDWTAYSSTVASTLSDATIRGLSADAARREVFTARQMKEYMDPRKVVIRESRDSEAHPESTAIIIGLDVTGSMGMIAEKMATEGLGKLVTGIIDNKPVTDPHIMIMGIGDAFCDSAPLQVSQFETDISIAEQLKDIWLEGCGGGNSFESYDLPWVFAARKTSIDCYEKRNKKGYLFTIGDELPPQKPLGKVQLNESGINAQDKMSIEDSLTEAQKTYSVFHIIVEQGSYASRSVPRVTKEWREVLGKRAINLNDYNYIAEVIQSVIAVNEGADPEEVANSWKVPGAVKSVKYALGLSKDAGVQGLYETHYR